MRTPFFHSISKFLALFDVVVRRHRHFNLSSCIMHHASSRIIIAHHHHASHIITTTNTTATSRCIPDHKGFSVNGIALSVTGKILFSVSEDCR